jgi:hypothetical protein
VSAAILPLPIPARTDDAGMDPTQQDDHGTIEDEESWTNSEKNILA